jgi:ABC-type transport system involved in Fe-S cluster assembly fused permease/ATPase subunit
VLTGAGRVPWSPLTLFVLFRWLDSGSGVQALQQYLWMPIDQYTHRSLTVAAYNHLMSLSYDFHSNKKTGEVWSSIAQGRSVNGFIESILFQVGPMLVDLCIAFAYFFWAFDAYMALIVAAVSVVYLWATFKLSAMRTDLRRELNTVGIHHPESV